MTRFRHLGFLRLSGPVLGVLLAACPAPEAETPDAGPQPLALAADLVVDANRDGVLDLAGDGDEAGEDSFGPLAGAVVLANLDDDDDDNRADADNEELDTDADLLDLAPLALRGVASIPDGTTGRLSFVDRDGEYARLWRLVGDDPARAESWVGQGGPVELDTATLRAGATFRVEALDVVTSAKGGAFDGRIDVRLELLSGETLVGEDTVQLRVAPVLFQFNTLPTQQIFHVDGGRYTRTLVDGIEAIRQGIPRVGIRPGQDFDLWAQDFFDVGAMVAPGPDGKPHVIKVAVRSAQPDRGAGLYVNRLRGIDWATLEISSPMIDASTPGYSMSSFGNWEVVPPYEKDGVAYPLGRNVWGQGSGRDEKPDPAFVDFVRAQQVQPPLVLDSSWLIVGHVDEFHAFVRSSSPRGWALLLGRPQRALEMLTALRDAGHGAVKLFEGKEYYDFDDPSWDPDLLPAEVTIDEVLADEDRLAASQRAELLIAEQRALLQAEIGLADEEILDVPFLFEEVWGGLIAYQPGTVNLLHADGRVVVPKPFGPLVDGADPFETDLVERLGAIGLEVVFADDWDTFHINMGEVHCGTNVTRDASSLAWWESGR